MGIIGVVEHRFGRVGLGVFPLQPAGLIQFYFYSFPSTMELS